MNADQLHHIATQIEDGDSFYIDDAAAYLRACADALDAGPVAWVRRHQDGTITEEFLPHSVIEQVRRDSGAWAALYTLPIPDQAHTLRLPEPMSHAEQDALLIEQGFTGSVKLTRDVGPYDISEATPRARDIISAIEAEILRRVRKVNE